MQSIEDFLTERGPSLASEVSRWLVKEQGLSAEAARKRVSRIKPPVRAFPISLLPKGARFLYLQHQREDPVFWPSFLGAMRATSSIYGMAIDGLTARQGVVTEEEFNVISGATIVPVKRQVMASSVQQKLLEARVIQSVGDSLVLCRDELCNIDMAGRKARDLAEKVILDGVREWARRLGLASYNKIAIRGEPELKPIGQFSFDLAGPSYLLPLKRGAGRPGFFIADVFAAGPLDEFQIRYFIRKAEALHASMGGATVLPLLVADSFTGNAATAAHSAGIILATPSSLFGKRVGSALKTLLSTLNSAARSAASDKPDKILGLLNDLSEIEGRAGNLRGPLFELMAAYLARRDAVSIDMGVRASDEETGNSADIDILKITNQSSSCTTIECKAREPGGFVDEATVSGWLKRTAIFKAHLKAQSQFRESAISFEIWTTGTFAPDALTRLVAEKAQRSRYPIDWKDGAAVLKIARSGRERAVAAAFEEHFMRHPLAAVRVPHDDYPSARNPASHTAVSLLRDSVGEETGASSVNRCSVK